MELNVFHYNKLLSLVDKEIEHVFDKNDLELLEETKALLLKGFHAKVYEEMKKAGHFD